MAAQPQQTIVDRFAIALAYRGITPAQLALRAGDSGRTTVYRYVNGTVAYYRQNIVARYAKALGCSPLWLTFGNGWDPEWAPDWKP
jgi:Cro/C1-type HTH DNA-binding domain